MVIIVGKSVAWMVAGMVLLLALMAMESTVMSVVQKLVLPANGVYLYLVESNSIPVATTVL